ncbi:MAG: hypothetical protein FWF44_07740 [Defluviitaleaceae bacterium]|nr:hypothetical protein [Defluviitaleaceae bacterium]
MRKIGVAFAVAALVLGATLAMSPQLRAATRQLGQTIFAGTNSIKTEVDAQPLSDQMKKFLAAQDGTPEAEGMFFDPVFTSFTEAAAALGLSLPDNTELDGRNQSTGVRAYILYNEGGNCAGIMLHGAYDLGADDVQYGSIDKLLDCMIKFECGDVEDAPPDFFSVFFDETLDESQFEQYISPINDIHAQIGSFPGSVANESAVFSYNGIGYVIQLNQMSNLMYPATESGVANDSLRSDFSAYPGILKGIIDAYR